MKKINNILKKLGPGLLFAGAAIGVSHLVQSTRAGADFGWGLVWALLIINVFKYPFFQYGPRYAISTGKTLLDGYYKLGKGYLWFYFILNFATMFTIQTAVTIVTSGLASELFGLTENMVIWSVIITVFCSLILIFGKYKTLDKVIKVIIIVLAISSVLALLIAFSNYDNSISIKQIFPRSEGIIFLIAFMGWMPAPLDISIWHSIWTLEKNKIQKTKVKIVDSMFDFNVGYITTVILGLCFIGLGALVMYGSGESFSNQEWSFCKTTYQSLYFKSWSRAYLIIACCIYNNVQYNNYYFRCISKGNV